MGATDSGLEHSSTPNRNRVFPAHVMYLPCAAVPSDPSQLDIDNAIRPQLNGSISMSGIGDALIKTDRCANHALQLCMGVDLIPLQRLLNHQQVELIKSLQVSAVTEIIRGVGIDREEKVRKLPSNFGDERKILSPLD